MSDYDNIQNALNHIDPQDRETWFRMGAAIKDELGENGFEMWDNWSRQSDNYKQQDAQSVWKSIKVGHIHIASLFKTARENGYRPEKPYTPPSAEELAKRSQIAQEKQQAEANRIAQAHAKAEKTAYGIWQNASPADPKHAYAQSKGLDVDILKGIRQNEYQGKKQLIIPLYADKKLVNVQTIDEDGNKKFLNGGQKQGAYTIIGDFKQNQQGIILAEGFATAASVHEATGKPVVVAFDAGNLKAVSEKLLNVLPENVPVYFAADQDPSQTGLHKAQAAAEVWGERAQILLPEFSPTQIQQYQQEKGADKVPTDFNDLHKLAGIDAVRERFGLAMVQETEIETEADFRQPEMEHVKPELSREELLKNNYWRVANGYDPLPETPKPEPQQNFRQPENVEPQEIRTAWNDFPPVISNGKLGDLKNEPEYPAAKAGDVVQSALLVEKLLKDETIQEIKNLIGDNQPILVPIQSEEVSGKNRIPHATARALADKLGLQVDTDIVQSNTVKRTDTGIYHRYVAPPEFKGEVKAGQSYLIVDDTLSVGGTIATLKGYIENNGGKVIGSTVMTAHDLKVNIAIEPNMLQSLQQKQGLNEYWKQEFGYGVDKLTQQEAGHLRKPTLEQIQERVQEARQNLPQNKELNHEQTTQSVETQQRPVHPTSEIDGASISGTGTVWQGRGQVLQSVLQQPQPPRNEEISILTQTATSMQDVAVSFDKKENIMVNQNEKYDPLAYLDEPEHTHSYLPIDLSQAHAMPEREVQTQVLQAMQSRQLSSNLQQLHDNIQAAVDSNDAQAFAQHYAAYSSVNSAFNAMSDDTNLRQELGMQPHVMSNGNEIWGALIDEYPDVEKSLPMMDKIDVMVNQTLVQKPEFAVATEQFRQPENPEPKAESQTKLTNESTQATTSENDVVASISEKEQNMGNSNVARLDGIRLNWSENSQDTNLHFKDLDRLQEWFKQNNPSISLAEKGYNKNNITLFLTDANGEKHEITKRIDVSVTGNDFNPNNMHIAEYRPIVELLAAYGIEQEKNRAIPQNQDLSEPEFKQPENEREPDFYDYNFEDLPKERPQVIQNQATEPKFDLPNSIEYEAFQREIDPAEPEKTEFRQPENTSVAQTTPTTELEIEEPGEAKNEPERPAPEQEKPNTGLDYEVPEHLRSRMVALDTQRFRLMNHEMGAHLLRYTAPDNPKTVLFEDKGKSIHTAKDDKQTIQDMLDVAKAKGWDSIKISGSQEFKQQMWLEAESRGITTKGYKPSPEDLAILERRREERATNSIAEVEKLKQQSAVPEHPNGSTQTIPQEAVRAADTVKTYATQAQQTSSPKPSNAAKAQYESKLATLPTQEQHKARFYERQALAAMRHMPAEFHEKTRQAIYENQTDLIRDGKYHAPDPMKSVERQPEKAQEKAHEQHRSRDDDWEMER